MRYLLYVILALSSSEAQAFDCPKSAENYLGEVLALRHQQEALTQHINITGDTAMEIALVKQSIAVDDRISAIVHRMFECDAIGRLSPNN